MGNTLITPIWTLKEVGRSLVNNLKFAANVSRTYDDQFIQGGAKVGWFVNARLPQRFRTTRGQALQIQGLNDNIVPIALTDQLNIAFGWSSAQATLEIEDMRRRYINPAGSQLANTIDADGLRRCYPEVFWLQKSDDLTNTDYLSAGALLTDVAVPEPRIIVTSARMMAAIVGKNLQLFNPSAVVSQGFRKGVFATDVLGWEEWYQDQNVATHTVGPAGGVPLVTGANQTGSQLLVKGFTAAIGLRFKRGDEFTIGGVEAINPQSYDTIGSLQTFTVLGDVYSDVAGNATIPINPPIVPPPSNAQTVTASPADNAPITLIGAPGERWQQGLGFTEDAFALAMADLEMPMSGKAERIRSKELGIAIRFWQDSMITDDSHPSRLDVLIGWKTVRPEMAMRIWGKVLP